MGFLEFNGIRYVLDDGRVLFDDVSFSVRASDVAALVGPNGSGKTMLANIAIGKIVPQSGYVNIQGGMAYMPQFIGSSRGPMTVRELLLAAAPERIAKAAAEVDSLADELATRDDDETTQMRYAQALAAWGEVGGYDVEVLWDKVTTTALDLSFDAAQYRDVRTLSGGEQKRLVLETLFRGSEQVLVLDEPDNYLDVPGKRWLEERLQATNKAVLLISHDRELLAKASGKVIAMEGHGVWVHGGSFRTWKEARQARYTRLAELHRRWDEEHARLKEMVRVLGEQAKISPAMAARLRAAQTRLKKYEEAGRPAEMPKEQRVAPRLTGGRTGVRAVTCQRLELVGLMKPFDLEVFFGDRVAVLGPNGSGKSHLLRLLGGEPVNHVGEWKLGARVVPGLFAQTHEHPEWTGRSLVDIMGRGDDSREGLPRGEAISALDRYELAGAADQQFETLSGGQQARFQILLLELSGATLLLLDEPTDNLDLVSAEALQKAIEEFQGTVMAVTHDRWFANSLDRYLLFRSEGEVVETAEPTWDELRTPR